MYGDTKPVVMEFDKSVPGGVPSLGTDGKVPMSQLPAGEPNQLVQLDASGKLPGSVFPSNVPTLPTPGENLLDNWYLMQPINQIGITGEDDITSTGSWHRGPDRWFLYAPGKWSLDANGIFLESVNSASWNFLQVVTRFGPKANFPKPNVTWTYSVMIDDQVYSATATGMPAETSAALPLGGRTDLQVRYRWGIMTANYPAFDLRIYAPFLEGKNGIHIQAIKLELGDQQTLCRVDQGVATLRDPPPDIGEMLARCQRYAVRLFTHNTNTLTVLGYGVAVSAVFARFTFSIPATLMTVAPQIIARTGTWIMRRSVAPSTPDYPITNVEIQSANAGQVIVGITTSTANAFTVGDSVVLIAKNSETEAVTFVIGTSI